MDFVKEWISSILIAAFIINLIDMLLPSGNLKSYINLALNFIFIFIVITPIINNFTNEMSIEDKILKEFNEFQYGYNEKLMAFDKNIDKEKIRENYNNYLKESINLKLEEQGYKLESIEIEGNEVKNLVIKELKTNKNSNNESKEKIEFKESENCKEAFSESKVHEENIKNTLNKVFKVSIEKIKIN
ncbi:stage III sporulation protein AF [Tepidibacter formicigenes]|jgi:stage III sporulation protein AF|uniref:Stage III sporulation protein AF n=1 Tax=Tepidibacter formicigenes DSM 15518 TaxID=1123349 RepID=A0A1M6L311_9FIRM|nr:stage III sporulation protein AF [Tepidibacter formicigenes]SHJ65625.1 stage III sporulation protein AF [Tepidibacter formicigenes DSM 15518]